MAVRPYQDADAAAVVFLANQVDPYPITLEAFVAREARRQAEGFRLRWIAEKEGRVEGVGELAPFGHAPEGFLRATVIVAPLLRGKGTGSALLHLIEDTAREWGQAGLLAMVRDDDPASRQWAERRGYAVHAGRFESILDLTTFNEGAHRSVKERLQARGVRFCDMVGHSEEAWTRLFDFFADRLDETPDHQGVPRWSRKEVRGALYENPGVRPEWIVLAESGGEWWGLTVLTGSRGETLNFLTGVAPPHRGQGLARALKLEIIARAKAAGSTRMRTNNLSTNAAMLAVNEALGYEPMAGRWELRKELS